MSVENILKTGFRTWLKAVKMTPNHYLTLAKIFYNHKTTGCGWKKQVLELCASNKEKLTPFIEEFEYAIDYTLGTTLFGTQAWFDKQYGKPIYPSMQQSAERQKEFFNEIVEKFNKDLNECFVELNEITEKTIKSASKGELD